MANPARDLHAILEPWMGGKSTTAEVRGFQTDAVSAAQQHVRAMELIGQISLALDELERRGARSIEVYRELLPNWTSAVLGYPNGWSGSGPNVAAMNSTRMDMLLGLSVLLDGMPLQVNDRQASGLEDFLDEIVSLLVEDDSIDDALRRYIHDLVAEIRRSLGDYRVTGQFDADRAVTHLWVAFEAARGQSKKHKARWRQAAQRLYTPVAAGLIANLPTLALEALKLGA